MLKRSRGAIRCPRLDGRFRDPNDDRRVWVVFDWDAEGFRNFVSDPDVPAILRKAALRVDPRRLNSSASMKPDSKATLIEAR